MSLTINPKKVKKESEKIIIDHGGKICDWLPWIDRANLRPINEVLNRALVMNALLNIYFKAPTSIIKDWIERYKLSSSLTEKEIHILEKNNDELSKQELIDLYWYIESLWSLMWATSIIDEMPFDRCIEDYMASLCPNLQVDEGPEKFIENMKYRSIDEIFRQLDLHFRLHWWTRDANLNGYDTGNVSLDIIMERRHALEWIMNPECEWENVPMDT